MKDEDGIVNIHGKSYETVASRVGKFRAKYPDWSIQTELVLDDNNRIVMKSVIGNSDGMIVASGYAEEVRGSSNINTTSALENAETSAIGRALSALGMGGTSYASADEVANAIGQQNEKALYARFKDFTTALVENFKSVDAVKLGIMDAQATETVKNQFEFASEADLSTAIEAWGELDTETKAALWLAPTKGGCFTTVERAIMKSDRWAALSREMKTGDK